MIIFIDFEASSLSSDSWPVEIGLAWITPNNGVVSYGRLIRPHQSWSEGAWPENSAAIHGIPRAALDDADPAEAVALWTSDLTRGARPLSDAPPFDQHWMDMLFATLLDLPAPRLRDFDAAAWATFNWDSPAITPAYRAVCAARERRNPRAHRTDADAGHLAEAWAAGMVARGPK